jgi:hypothetical protein
MFILDKQSQVILDFIWSLSILNKGLSNIVIKSKMK